MNVRFTHTDGSAMTRSELNFLKAVVRRLGWRSIRWESLAARPGGTLTSLLLDYHSKGLTVDEVVTRLPRKTS